MIPLRIPAGFSAGYSGKAVACVAQDIMLLPGETSILVGNNGAGKSTFLKTLSGLLPPVGPSTLKTSCVFLPEEMDFPPAIMVGDIIEAFFPESAKAADTALLWGLPVKAEFGVLSKGNRQKLRILIAEFLAYLGGASLLCLDEPLSGVDALSAKMLVVGWNDGVAMPVFRGHRILSVHRGTVPDASQIIVVANGRISTLPPITNCDDWMDYAAANGIDL